MRDLDQEFSRFCEALSEQEKRKSPTIKRRLIRLKRLAVKLKRCLARPAVSEVVGVTK